MIAKVFTLYSLLKTTSSKNVVFIFFKASNWSLFLLKLAEICCMEGDIATSAACKLKNLWEPVHHLSLFGGGFLGNGQIGQFSRQQS